MTYKFVSHVTEDELYRGAWDDLQRARKCMTHSKHEYKANVEEFKKGLNAFLQRNGYISGTTETGAYWPAAALAGLFAGAALHAHLLEVPNEGYDKQHRAYFNEYTRLCDEFQDADQARLREVKDADQARLRKVAVQMVVYRIVWIKFPRDISRCAVQLHDITDETIAECFALLVPPDEVDERFLYIMSSMQNIDSLDEAVQDTHDMLLWTQYLIHRKGPVFNTLRCSTYEAERFKPRLDNFLEPFVKEKGKTDDSTQTLQAYVDEYKKLFVEFLKDNAKAEQLRKAAVRLALYSYVAKKFPDFTDSCKEKLEQLDKSADCFALVSEIRPFWSSMVAHTTKLHPR